MARFVLAGRADCPYYAKAEHLAELLHRTLPHFTTHNISIHPHRWQDWLEATCRANGWRHQHSPLVWRELVHRGGGAMYLGGINDFLEHCQEYYSITSDMPTDVMLRIAAENLESEVKLREEEERRVSLIQPLHIWIAGALNPACHSLLPHLLSSQLFPQVSTTISLHLLSSQLFPQVSTTISLHLLDLEAEEEALQGLRMEIEDLALPLLHQVSVHVDLERAFQDADLVILLDDRWPEDGDVQGEEEDDEETKKKKKKKDLRRISVRYEAYGRLMDGRAHREVMVLVAGDTFINLKCSLLLDHAPSIDSRRFVAVATQLEYEARAHIAKKLSVRTSDVSDVVIWGNISGSSYVDLQRAKVFNHDGAIKGPAFFSRAVLEVLHDRKWVNTDLPALVRRQRSSVTSRAHRTGSMSATNSILHVLKAWRGTSSNPGQVLSLGVLCPGHYDLPEGVVLSMPVTFSGGGWSALFDPTMMGPDLRGALQRCAEELKEEKLMCFQACYEDLKKTPVPSGHVPDPQPSLLT